MIMFSHFLFLLVPVSQLEILKQDHERLDLQLQDQKQKFSSADVERINREKQELEKTLSSLTKALEEAEQHKWNEEIALAKAKERVSVLPQLQLRTCSWSTMNPVHVHCHLSRPLLSSLTPGGGEAVRVPQTGS